MHTIKPKSSVQADTGTVVDGAFRALDEKTVEEIVQKRKKYEYEAEEEGMKTLALCGYHKAIKAYLEYENTFSTTCS